MNPILNIGLPVGGSQIKKTVKGLQMFDTDKEHPIAGSYTDNGELRFPVDDNWKNRIQAGLFGQWANENARDYIENGRKPLSPKKTKEFISTGFPIADYWKYNADISKLKTAAEKADFINGLDLSIKEKNILINNALKRKEKIDMSNYNDYGSFEEFDYAMKYPKKYKFLKDSGVSYNDYANADEKGKAAYSWAYNNPAECRISRLVTDDLKEYHKIYSDINKIYSDRDSNGKPIQGSRRKKVVDYINNLDVDLNAKYILYRNEYQSDNTYNGQIINYINNSDTTYYEKITLYKSLGFIIRKGKIYWN